MATLSSILTSSPTATADIFIWIAKDSDYTAKSNEAILADTNSSSWVLTLPANPVIGNTIAVIDDKSTFYTNNLTINGNSNLIDGNNTNLTLDVPQICVQFVYIDPNIGWVTSTKFQGSTNPIIPGYIDGFIMSNNATNPNSQINIGSGECVCDLNKCSIELNTSFTKTITGTWVVGSGKNGLDTGAKANSTWYHVYAIKKNITGECDILFSTNASSPTMPTGYTPKRRIGSVFTNGSGNIQQFTQFGEQFLWKTVVSDINAATWQTSGSSLLTLSIPLGVQTKPIIAFSAIKTAASVSVLFTPPSSSISDQTPSATFATRNYDGFSSAAGVRSEGATVGKELISNTSSQIRVRSDTAATVGYVVTHGWLDTRGIL